MKKSDLEYGNVIETRIGDKYLFNFNKGDQLLNLITGNSYLCLSDFNEDLTNCDIIFDAMKVYKDYTCKELLWERKEPKLTEDEKAILKVLLNEKYKWIARDDDEMLVVFERKPHKAKWGCSQWACGEGSSIMVYMEIFSNLFQFIKWEDEEPYLIEDLLKGEEK